MDLDINKVILIGKVSSARRLANDILRNQKIIAIDFEGKNLGSERILLMQVAFMPANYEWKDSIDSIDHKSIHPQIYVIDALPNDGAILNEFKSVFESPDIVKIFHDARSDLKALKLFNQLHIENLFDTSIADIMIQEQESKDGTRGQQRSLTKIAEIYGGPVNPVKLSFKDKYYKRGVAYWDQRPLTRDHLFHAAHDVFSLIPHVYCRIKEMLRQSSWATYQSRIDTLMKAIEKMSLPVTNPPTIRWIRKRKRPHDDGSEQAQSSQPQKIQRSSRNHGKKASRVNDHSA